MRKIAILLMLCCIAAACKKTEIKFTYSPTEPRAGEEVKFSNLSSSGEEWEWSFGDGSTSTIKSPTYTYKKPGTYRVVLKVDKKNSLTATEEITVYDTIPTFVASDSIFHIYKDYTFTANVYNPYNYEVLYEWRFPLESEYAVCTDEDMTGSSLHCYFTQALEEAPIELTVVMSGDTTEIQRTYRVQDLATNSIYMRTKEGDYRQRIFGKRAAETELLAQAEPLLNDEQDTIQTYNGHTFALSDFKALIPGIEGFHIASRKIYYRADGLWVANIDGTYPVQIDSLDCPAMTLDLFDSRICWANENGVWYMPFVGSDNNKFVTEPTQLNSLEGVTKIASDNEAK